MSSARHRCEYNLPEDTPLLCIRSSGHSCLKSLLSNGKDSAFLSEEEEEDASELMVPIRDVECAAEDDAEGALTDSAVKRK